jgi:hypothetical protein
MPPRGASGESSQQEPKQASSKRVGQQPAPPTLDPFQQPKERLADKIAGLASAALQTPTVVHARTAAPAALHASRDAAQHRERALARLGVAVHQSLPSALQDFDRELDVALERAEAVQRCLSVLEGAQARRQEQQQQQQRRR